MTEASEQRVSFLSLKLKAHNSQKQFVCFQSGLKLFMKFSFLLGRIQRTPIYRILNDLITAHVAGVWGGLEAVAWGKSSGMTLPSCSAADAHGGPQEKNSMELQRWDELEIMQGIKSPDCV